MRDSKVVRYIGSKPGLRTEDGWFRKVSTPAAKPALAASATNAEQVAVPAVHTVEHA